MKSEWQDTEYFVGCSWLTTTPTITTIEWLTQHDTTISATCMRARFVGWMVVTPASWCVGHIWSVVVVVVVVACSCMHSATSANSWLVRMVLLPSATCTGGAISSSYWRKNCTYTWATCSVREWSMVVIVVLNVEVEVYKHETCTDTWATLTVWW